MSDFRIITDSCVDMDGQMVRDLDLTVLPLRFTIGGEIFENDPDGKSLPVTEMYARLRQKEKATTSAVNMADFAAIMEPILAGGEDVLLLAFSSGLSATYAAAYAAGEEMREKYPDRKIFVVDTLCASLGQGLLVYLAVQKKREGMTIEEVRDWAEENKLHLCHQFTVDDLFFLKRGGRVSGATAVVGSMLAIKPVLHVDNEGHLINIDKKRGRKNSLKALCDTMERTAINPAEQIVFISHGDCMEDAQELADMVRERMGVTKFYINCIGPVIGAHAGPGTVALFYLGTER